MRRVLLIAALLAFLSVGCSGEGGGETTAARGPTAERLAEVVTVEGLRAHLVALQQIADENGGTRASGTPGYDASVGYVVEQLREAGYEPRLHRFRYTDSRELAPAELDQLSPDAATYVAGEDFIPLRYSGGGEVDAVLEPVDADSETSGCESSDFDGFPRGAIALVRRGGCFFSIKVGNASDAGAAAVLVFNDGSPGHETPMEATLVRPVELPALSLANDIGEELAHAAQPIRLHVSASIESGEVVDANVLADLPGTRQGAPLLLGAHLDSVVSGPGINDNGSGVATLLELAKQARRIGYRPERPVRFAFWAAEEPGIVGSTEYVESLASAAEIGAVVNLDTVGSPNAEALVYEGDPRIENVLADAVRAEGLEPVPIQLEGRSDHAPFAEAGVPVGGLFTGADDPGPGGNPHDPCYHRPCDTIENVDVATLEHMADALAIALTGLTRSL
jgi:Zn-dependent M28 family amino/carboxypeptidase